MDNSIDFFLRSQTYTDLAIGTPVRWFSDETGTLDLKMDIDNLDRLYDALNGITPYNFILIAEHHTWVRTTDSTPFADINYADLDNLNLCYRTAYPVRYSNYCTFVFKVRPTNQLHL